MSSGLPVAPTLRDTEFVKENVGGAESDGGAVTLADFDIDAVADADGVEKMVRVFVGIDGFDVPLLDTVTPADADKDADDDVDIDARGDADTIVVSVRSGDDDDATDCDAESVIAADNDAEPVDEGEPVADDEAFADRENAELFVDEAEKHAVPLAKALDDALRLAAFEDDTLTEGLVRALNEGGPDTETDDVDDELAAEDALSRAETEELCVPLRLRADDTDARGDADVDTEGEVLGDTEAVLVSPGDIELLRDARALPVSLFVTVTTPELDGDAESDTDARFETDGAVDEDEIAVADSLTVIVRDFSAEAEATTDAVIPDALEKAEGETEACADAESALLKLEAADTLGIAVPDANTDAVGDESSDSVAAALSDRGDEGDGTTDEDVIAVKVADTEFKLDALADVPNESVAEADGDPLADGSDAVGSGVPDNADDALPATVEDTVDTALEVIERVEIDVPNGDADTSAVAVDDGVGMLDTDCAAEFDETADDDGETDEPPVDESTAELVAHSVDFAVTEGEADVVSEGLDDDESNGDDDSMEVTDRVAIEDGGKVGTAETDTEFEARGDALWLPVVDALGDGDRD